MNKVLIFLLSLSAILGGVSTGFALNLNSKNAELTQQVNQQTEQLETTNKQNEGINKQLDDANQLIKDYQDQIDELESNKICAVSFDLKGEILDTDAIKSGECVSVIPSLPSSMTDSVVINGWLLADGTSVDPLTYVVSENITFFADYTLKYLTQIEWTFPTGAISAGSWRYITSHTVPTTRTNSNFDETWTYCGDYIVDKLYAPGEVFTFENVEDNTKMTKIIPMFSHNVTFTFKVESEIVDTQEFVLYNAAQGEYLKYTCVDTTLIETPTKDGYTFKGWAIEGAEDTIIDLNSKTLSTSTVFVAVFE